MKLKNQFHGSTRIPQNAALESLNAAWTARLIRKSFGARLGSGDFFLLSKRRFQPRRRLSF